MTESRAATPPKVLGIFDNATIRTLERLGLTVLRYGMVALLLLWGIFKFAAFEAEAIQPLVGNSPLLRWLYPLLGIRGTSALIGVVEIVAGILVITRTWKPGLSAIGSLLTASAFLVTLSFLITTPGALSATNPFSGFLLKDIMLLGAALYTAAEALQAAQQG